MGLQCSVLIVGNSSLSLLRFTHIHTDAVTSLSQHLQWCFLSAGALADTWQLPLQSHHNNPILISLFGLLSLQCFLMSIRTMWLEKCFPSWFGQQGQSYLLLFWKNSLSGVCRGCLKHRSHCHVRWAKGCISCVWQADRQADKAGKDKVLLFLLPKMIFGHFQLLCWKSIWITAMLNMLFTYKCSLDDIQIQQGCRKDRDYTWMLIFLFCLNSQRNIDIKCCDSLPDIKGNFIFLCVLPLR